MTFETATRDETAAKFVSDADRWDAVVRRDPAANDVFYYSVRTTGVYCRPSCAARLARRENVRFHATCADAEAAGFRPCKRCRPNEAAPPEQQAAAMAKARRLIEDAEEAPDLDAVTTAMGMSRFHATSSKVLGITPTDFRAGGTSTAIRFAVGECSLGAILVAASGKGICAILLGDDAGALVRDVQDRFPNATLIGGDAEFGQWVAKVVGFVEAPGLGLVLPLDVRGTAFQQRVWRALCDIPIGSTASYGEIAERIGAPKAFRAVARACGANPLAVAIPCHRIVRNDGALSGYRWGVERKRSLLDREAAA